MILRLAAMGCLLAVSADALAWCQLRSRSGEVTRAGECATEGAALAWQDRCVSYSVNSAGSRDLDLASIRTIAAESFANWSEQTCGEEPFPIQVREDEPRACVLAQHLTDDPNIHTLTFVEEWPEDFEPTAYAITSVWHRASDGAILDADILINENNGPFGECPARGCRPDENDVTTVDLESVLTHEIGHFFGLGHSQFGFATMHASAPRGETDKRTVSSDDALGICAIYPPGGPAGECDFTPLGGLAEFCEPQTGCATSPAGGSGASAMLLALAALVLRRRRPIRRRRTRSRRP